MNAAVSKPHVSSLFLTALMTLPLLMPGARRRYGTLPVVLGVFALGREVLTWMEARRTAPTPELEAASRDPDIATSPHLRAHLE